MVQLSFMSVTLLGCSFAFVSSPPDHPKADAACTESRRAPIADVVGMAASGIGGIALVAAPNNCSYANQTDCTANNIGQGVGHAMGAVLLVTGLVYAVSALRGFSATGECRRLHRI